MRAKPEPPVSTPDHPTFEHALPLHTARPAVPPRPEDASGFARLLRKVDFRDLWTAQCISQLAQNLMTFALLVVVYEVSQSASQVAAVAVALTFPGVIFSAPAGVYADRHDKRTLMIVTNLMRAALLLLFPVTQLLPGLRHEAWPLLVITFLFSSAGQIFAPAEAASIPSLVSREQIQGAMSLFMTTVIFTIVLGSVVAPLTLLAGDVVPFYVAAALFAVAAFFVWRIRSPLRALEPGTVPQTHALQELRDGLGILRRSPALRWGMIQLALALIVVFTIYALSGPYLTRELHRSANDISIVLVPAMFGLVGTAGILGQHLITLARRVMLVAALFTAGGCLVAMGIAPSVFRHFGIGGLLLPLVVLLGLIFGCALGALLIPAFSVLQEGTTEESRGRIFGSVFTVINAAIALPLLVAGGATDLTHSVAGVVIAFGAAVLGVGVVFRTLLWHQLTVLDPLHGTGAPG